MLKIEVIETVYHTSTLSDEEEKIVMDYIKNNPEKFEYESAENKITKAIWELYFELGSIDIYRDSVDSDTSTEEINWSEFEERKAFDILKSHGIDED